MHILSTPLAKLRMFWGDYQQRRTLMWVIIALSLAVVAAGAYLVISGQIAYHNKSKDVDKIQAQIESLTAQYPKAEVDGEVKPDLRDATDEEISLLAQMLAPLKQQERKLINERVDSDNQRRTGVRIIGFGVIGLAFAYLIAPTRKPSEDEPVPAPDAAPSDQPPAAPPTPPDTV